MREKGISIHPSFLVNTFFREPDMELHLRRYKKDVAYSYTYGVYPTLELLHHRPEDLLGVVIHPKGETNVGISKIHTFCQKHQIPFEIDEKTHNRLGARDNDYAIGVFRMVEPGLAVEGNHIVLVNPGSRGNLGTIIRTMLGFDFQDLAIIQPAVDIFHPEVIRASMGALFQMRFERFKDFEVYRNTYPRNLYALIKDGETLLQDTVFKPPYGLIFGNESSGLSDEYRRVGTSVTIPQSNRIDSLNLATAVSVSLYQAKLRQERY
jgi:TrmH family RNA methyltransferase